jgi:hypothetical protein
MKISFNRDEVIDFKNLSIREKLIKKNDYLVRFIAGGRSITQRKPM